MKPIKAIMALLAAIIILPACNEEEWENLTYEQKVIETLLKQQKPKHDIGHELIDSMRYVILKTGIQLSPEEASAGLQHGPNPETGYGWGVTGGNYFAEYYEESKYVYPTDTIGIVRSVNTLRQELEISEDKILTYKGYEVLGIEDVTVDKGPIKHSISLVLYSERDIAKVVEYVASLGCRVASINSGDIWRGVSISVVLPLNRKAIPTRDEIMHSKLKIDEVNIIPYLSQFGWYD